MDIHIQESTSLGIIGDAMCAILGILDVADRNPVLYGFDHAFRYQEKRFDDCTAILDGVDRQFPDQLPVRSMHPEEHRDNAEVTEDLQHNRSVDTSDRVDRTGLHETGSAGISRRDPRHRRGQQYRHLLRSQCQSYGSQSEFCRSNYGIHECHRVRLRHPRAADRRRDCQGFD